MKINEITNAEDILALWKLISDNTWSAIQQQADQQAREKAERAAKTKSTKGAKRGGGRRSPPIAIPKLPAVPATPLAKTAVAPVQLPISTKVAAPSTGPLGAANTPAVAPAAAPAPAPAPVKPVVPIAAAQQKQDTQLKLSARDKGVVRV
jgi:hypothetical protein